jgi:hypothetical protein
MAFRVLYPASVSIDAADFNEAFKNAVKLNTFLNVEQMIIADQFNNYRRANIGYTNVGGGRRRASIRSELVPYPAIAPLLVGYSSTDKDSKYPAGVLMTPGGPTLIPAPIVISPKTAEKPADKPDASTGAKPTETKPEEKKDSYVLNPFGGLMFSPANPIPGSGLQVLQPGSNQLLNMSPALPVGTDGKPIVGLARPFGIGLGAVPVGAVGYPGVFPYGRPGLVPVAGGPPPRVF